MNTYVSQYGEEISWNPENYNPTKHGIITAVRIFYDESSERNSMAELAFAFGGTHVIEWTNCTQREIFSKGFNGYTLLYDTRVNNDELIKELIDEFRQQIRKETP